MNIFKVLFKLSQLIIQVPASQNRRIDHLVPEGKARGESPPENQASILDCCHGEVASSVLLQTETFSLQHDLLYKILETNVQLVKELGNVKYPHTREHYTIIKKFFFQFFFFCKDKTNKQ